MQFDKPIIDQSDMNEYVAEFSDFTFEMKVVQAIHKEGFRVEHSGSYVDVQTQVTRQFDIRAQRVDIKDTYNLFLAVEATNLRSDFPMIVHCVLRRKEEAYHQLIHLNNIVAPPLPSSVSAIGEVSIYNEGKMVGKATDQVRRTYLNDRDLIGKIKTGDERIYKKITQSLHSAFDLAVRASKGKPEQYTAILPILVVPDETLWQVEYDDAGKMTQEPRKVEYLSYFIDKGWEIELNTGDSFCYRISHIEIVTLSKIPSLISSYRANLGGSVGSLFPKPEILSCPT